MRPVVLRHAESKKIVHVSAESVELQSSFHPWTGGGGGGPDGTSFRSLDVNSTALLQVVGLWHEDPVSKAHC